MSGRPARVRVSRAALLVLGCLAACAARAVDVTTWRYDIARSGQNTSELTLNHQNVNSNTFGKLYSYAVDGYVYAQPLYLGGLNFGGIIHNTLFVATEHDSVYAFDADANKELWSASLIDTAHGAASGATPVPSGDTASTDLVPEIGITGTPVIDSAAGTLYVVAKSKENGAYVQRLHALDVLTGNERAGSPVVIQGSVAGNGYGSYQGVIRFAPLLQLNRPGLLLLDGTVYVGFGSHGDNGPYHGWIFAYNAATLQQTGIFNTSPNGKGDAVWQAGGGLAADVVNGVPRLFIATGNSFVSVPEPKPPYTNTQNYNDSVVRFDLSNGGLQVSDDWTPFDEAALSARDTDQGSGGVLILPDQGGAVVHELVQVGKNGRIEVIDRDNLGGFNSSYNAVVQEISGQVHGLWSTPAYWNGNVYFWGFNDYLRQFSLNNGRLSATPVASSSLSSNFPGSSPVISSNGTNDGIVWVAHSSPFAWGGPAVLYAFDATNVGTLLYRSDTQGARDTAGTAVKCTVPVVVNGKVYMAAQGAVNVYGLLAVQPPTAPKPTFSPAPRTYATPQSVTLSDTLSGATIHYTIDGTAPTIGSPPYPGPIPVSATTTIKAIAVAPGYNASDVASGTYTITTPSTINFSNGFASIAGLTLNGSAVNTADGRLELTTAAVGQAGSFFYNSRVNVQSFSTDFTFQLAGTAPIAEGITFTIQTNAPTALGPSGGGLGYGAQQPNGAPGIPGSVAVKFDVNDNVGEGSDSTGVYSNGASPTVPATDLTASGIVLSSGDTISAHLVYDGTWLYLTLRDTVSGAVFVNRWKINIPQTIGANTAFVGFTGSTGTLVATQKILTWTFAAQPTLTAVQYEAETLHAVSSGPVFRVFSWSGFPDGKGTVLDSTKVGDSVTFTVNIPQAATYDLHVTGKDYNVRGIWQLSVDGVNVGSPEDQYSPTETFVDFDLGPLAFTTAGNHIFKFTVTGRNPASMDWKICFDYLRFNAR